MTTSAELTTDLACCLGRVCIDEHDRRGTYRTLWKAPDYLADTLERAMASDRQVQLVNDEGHTIESGFLGLGTFPSGHWTGGGVVLTSRKRRKSGWCMCASTDQMQTLCDLRPAAGAGKSTTARPTDDYNSLFDDLNVRAGRDCGGVLLEIEDPHVLVLQHRYCGTYRQQI